MTELVALLKNPLVLGAVLLGFGALWILVALVLSWIFPVSASLVEEEDAPPAVEPEEPSVFAVEPPPVPAQDPLTAARARQGDFSGRLSFLQADGGVLRERVSSSGRQTLLEIENLKKFGAELTEAEQEVAAEARLLETNREGLPELVERVPSPLPDLTEWHRRRDEERGRAAQAESGQERRRVRLKRRLDRWALAWEERLAGERRALEAELARLREEASQAGRVRDEHKRAAAERQSRLDEDRRRLEEARRRFAAEVDEPARLARERELEHRRELEQRERALRLEIQGIEARREEARARDAEDRRVLVEKKREQRDQWALEARSWKADVQRQRDLWREDLQRLRGEAEAERARMQGALQTEASALEEELKREDDRRIQAEAQAAEERRRTAEELSQAAGRAEALQAARDAQSAFAEETMVAHARQAASRRAWIEKRRATLAAVLDGSRQRAARELAGLEAEKTRAHDALVAERLAFEAARSGQQGDFQARRDALAAEEKQAAARHDAFLAESSRQADVLAQHVQELEVASARLENRNASLRLKNAQALIRRRRRYEKILLNEELRAAREQGQVESRQAQERMALAGLASRIDHRHARLERLLVRRREVLDGLLDEVRAASETAARARAGDVSAWAEKLAEARRRRTAGEERRAFLEGRPLHEKGDQAARAAQEARFFQEEKSRLARDARDRREAFLRDTAENQKRLHQALSEWERVEKDLSRQEDVQAAFLGLVRAQEDRLSRLRDYFSGSVDQTEETVLRVAGL